MIIDEHFQKNECIYEISKEVNGQITLRDFNYKDCTNLNCKSLLTYHILNAWLFPSKCDSEKGREIKDRIDLEIFHILNSDEAGRGYHYGTFTVSNNSVDIIKGKIIGLTNIRTYYSYFNNCESCYELAHMEGTLEGDILNAIPKLNGGRFVGSYSMKFKSRKDFGTSRINGIIEGVAICKCRNSE